MITQKKVSSNVLFGVYCFNGANISARPTVGTKVRIDHIDLPFRNGLNRTFIDACATGGAII